MRVPFCTVWTQQIPRRCSQLLRLGLIRRGRRRGRRNRDADIAAEINRFGGGRKHDPVHRNVRGHAEFEDGGSAHLRGPRRFGYRYILRLA
jgi:hypothetical protein